MTEEEVTTKVRMVVSCFKHVLEWNTIEHIDTIDLPTAPIREKCKNMYGIDVEIGNLQDDEVEYRLSYEIDNVSRIIVFVDVLYLQHIKTHLFKQDERYYTPLTITVVAHSVEYIKIEDELANKLDKWFTDHPGDIQLLHTLKGLPMSKIFVYSQKPPTGKCKPRKLYKRHAASDENKKQPVTFVYYATRRSSGEIYNVSVHGYVDCSHAFPILSYERTVVVLLSKE